MDRRASKLEKKRKGREQAKKKASALAARKPSAQELLVRSAARGELGPCFVSAGWDDLEAPALVSAIVTRKLASGQLVAGVALVDRTCLGIKQGWTHEPMFEAELSEFVNDLGIVHGGMLTCEPHVVQSVVFHAIDYARSLGFEPHRDFPAALFGPRPAELSSTPWQAPEQPIYVAGPRDDERAIIDRLTKAVGANGFKCIALRAPLYDEAELEELVHSPLECTVSRNGTSVHVCIYRQRSDPAWVLEVEDDRDGSTVWDEQFATDQLAFDAAMLALEEHGIESFTA